MDYATASTVRVATKCPRVAAAFFRHRDLAVEVVRLAGSVEIAPGLGLCDCIVDVVETGRTLLENGLEACEEIAAELSKIGRCTPLPADLSRESECNRLADEVAEREGGRLDILVNNAGANWGAPIEEFPEAAFDKVMGLNVKSVFLLTRRLIPALAAAATPDDPARVINIGSRSVPCVASWSTRSVAARLPPAAFAAFLPAEKLTIAVASAHL